MILSVTLSKFPTVLLLDLIYEDMKALRRSFQAKSLNVMVIGRDQIQYEVMKVKRDLTAYRRLMNRFDTASVQLQIGVLASYIISYPSVVTLLYFGFRIFSVSEDTLKMYEVTINLAFLLFSLFTIPLQTDLIVMEYEKILDISETQIATCFDETLAREKQRVRNYMKLRPFQFYVFRAWEVNLVMPLKFIAFCVSHLLVIIQIKHKKA
ncbi:unnamed protein product [Leptosia nina]|uniref:Gustatory receptor n=1 Tax=Leptosia nina TaxID=320188 RepID=A0AAV1JF21_9NEOP